MKYTVRGGLYWDAYKTYSVGWVMTNMKKNVQFDSSMSNLHFHFRSQDEEIELEQSFCCKKLYEVAKIFCNG